MGRSRIEVNRNDTYGDLVVIKEAKPRIRNSGREDRFILCKCSCGKKLEVKLNHLRNMSLKTKSCGCRKDNQIASSTTHGLSKNPLYIVFRHMHDRCYNKNNKQYKNYGGRGISVCKRWHGDEGLKKFISWAESKGYKRGLEIDRKNNNDRYCPENCRFVEKTINMNNKEDNVFIEYKGKQIRFSKFYKENCHKNVKYKTAYDRLTRLKWNPCKSVSTPVRSKIAAARRANINV